MKKRHLKNQFGMIVLSFLAVSLIVSAAEALTPEEEAQQIMESMGINRFVKRQTEESEFTHFLNSWEELIALTAEQFKAGNYSKGYRDGVVVIHMAPND